MLCQIMLHCQVLLKVVVDCPLPPNIFDLNGFQKINWCQKTSIQILIPLASLKFRNVNAMTCRTSEFADINLTELVTINKAMSDSKHIDKWDNAMAAEFKSLDDKNTGILSPPPSSDKIIAGMWPLTRKLNEFGKVVRNKAPG
jgi:hypothetical protein